MQYNSNNNNSKRSNNFEEEKPPTRKTNKSPQNQIQNDEEVIYLEPKTAVRMSIGNIDPFTMVTKTVKIKKEGGRSGSPGMRYTTTGNSSKDLSIQRDNSSNNNVQYTNFNDSTEKMDMYNYQNSNFNNNNLGIINSQFNQQHNNLQYNQLSNNNNQSLNTNTNFSSQNNGLNHSLGHVHSIYGTGCEVCDKQLYLSQVHNHNHNLNQSLNMHRNTMTYGTNTYNPNLHQHGNIYNQNSLGIHNSGLYMNNLNTNSSVNFSQGSPKNMNMQEGFYDMNSYNPNLKNVYVQNTYQTQNQGQGQNQGQINQSTITNQDKRMMNTYDSSKEYKLETYKPQRSPNRNYDQNEGIEIIESNHVLETEEEEIPMKEKLGEIHYMQNFTEKEREVMEKFTKLMSEESNMEKTNNLITRNYGDSIELIAKESDRYLFLVKRKEIEFNKNKTEGKIIPKFIKTLSEIIPEANWNNNLKNRHNVIKKLRKVKTILKSKNTKRDSRKSKGSDEDSSFDNKINRNSIGVVDNNKLMEFSKFSQGMEGGARFMRIALAMLSSKGSSCEDRIFNRNMRGEIGGVVDLGLVKEKKEGYVIKSIQGIRSPNKDIRKIFSSKEREKAIKIIQAWWRDLLNKYHSFVKRITQVQSTWRSHWYRVNMIDIMYISQMLVTYNNKVENVLDRKKKQTYFDILRDNFAVKYSARLYLLKLLKLQKNLRRWIGIQKDKKERLGNLLEKIVERRKKDTMDDLKDANNKKTLSEAKKEEDLKNLAKVTLKKARTAVFHDFMFKAMDKPANKLKSKVLRSSVKRNCLKLDLLMKRVFFMKWLKKCLGGGDYKKLAADVMKKAIMRPPVRDVLSKFRKLPPKDLKERMLRGILKNYENDSKKLLAYYLRLWNLKANKLKQIENIKNLNAKVMAKCAKSFVNRKLGEKLRLWDRVAKSKKDLRPYINGLPHLHKFVKQVVADKTIDPLKKTTTGIRSRVVKGLFNNGKFYLVPLRHYFNKWKNVADKDNVKDNTAKKVLSLRSRKKNKENDNLLQKKFLLWRGKSNLMNIMQKVNEDDSQLKKHKGLIMLLRGTEKLAKRKALSVTLPPIYNWLLSLIKDRAAKNISLMFPKLSKKLLRNYLRLWKVKKDQLKDKEKDLDKNSRLLRAAAKKFNDRKERDNLSNKLRLWSKNSKKPDNYYDRMIKGKDKVNQYLKNTLRKPYNDLLNNKNYAKLLKNCLPISCRLANKNNHDNLLRLWNVWKKVVQNDRIKDTKAVLLDKLSNKHLAVRNMNLKGKYFRLWKVKKTLHFPDVIKGSKIIEEVLKRPHRKPIIDALNGNSQANIKNKVLRSGVKRNKDKENLGLKAYLWNWRTKSRKAAENLLKSKLLATHCKKLGDKNDKESLAKAFYRWRDTTKKFENLKNLAKVTLQKTRTAIFHDFMFKALDKPANQLKSKFLRSAVKRNCLKLDLLMKRVCFMKWLKKCMGGGDYNKLAADVMKKAIMRPPVKDVFSKFKKLPPKDLKERLLRGILKNYEKDNNKLLAHYLRLWNAKANKIKQDEALKNLNTKMMAKCAKSFVNRKLGEKLRLWDRVAKSKKDLRPYINGLPHLHKFVKQVVADKTIDPLKKTTTGIRSRVVKGLFNNGKFYLVPLRHYFNKWKNVADKDNVKDNTAKKVLSLRSKKKNKEDNNSLLKKFLLWRGKSNLMNVMQKVNEDDSQLKKHKGLIMLLRGTEKLAKRKALSVTLPPIYNWLLSLIKERAAKNISLMFPKLSKKLLRNYLRLWKVKKDELKDKEKDLDKNSRLLRAAAKKFNDRKERDNLSNKLRLWSKNSKKPDNYYDRMINGKDKVNQYLKNTLRKPYNDLLNNKNYAKLMKNCLPISCRLAKKNNHDNLLRLWNVWKKAVQNDRINDTKAVLLDKLSNKHLAVRNMNLKGKYFRLWKVKKTLHFPDVIKGSKIIEEVLKRPHRKPILDALNGNSKSAVKNKVLRSGVKKNKDNNDLKLKAYLWNWRTKSRKAAENLLKSKLLATHCKKLGDKNDKESLAKAFYRWRDTTKKFENLKNLAKVTLQKTRTAIFHDFMFKALDKPANQLKSKFLRSAVKRNCLKLDLLMKRVCFMKWLKKCMGGGDYNKLAADVMKKAIMRPPVKDVFSKFKKLPPKDLKERLLRGILKNYEKDNNKLLAHYLRLWNAKANKIKQDEALKNLNAKMMAKCAKSFVNRKLGEKLRLWDRVAKSKKDLRPYINGLPHLHKFVKQVVADKTIDPLKKTTTGIRSRVVKGLFNNGKFYLVPLRHYFNKWKNVADKDNVKDNTAKKVLSLRSKKKNKEDNNSLLKKFLLWRGKSNLMNVMQKVNEDDSQLKKHKGLIMLLRGTEKLAKRKALSVTLPPIYNWLLSLIKERAAKNISLMFPKLSKKLLRNYLRLWKVKKDELKDKEKDLDKNSRLLRAAAKKFNDRKERDNLSNKLRLWSKNSKKPDNYYDRMIKGKDKVNEYLKNTLRKPYNDLLNNKNYAKLLKNCLPISCRLAKKNNHDNLLRLWNVWKKAVQNDRINDTKAVLLDKLSNKHLAVRNMNLKGKYFRLWKVKKTLHFPDVIKGSKIIEEVLKKPHRKPILDALSGNSKSTVKNKVLRSGVKKNKDNNDLKLKAYLWNWRTKSRKAAEGLLKSKLLATHCKKLGDKNDKNSLAKAFYKWKNTPKNNFIPIKVGTNVLQKALEKKPFDDLKEKTKMMNLKIPNGTNLSHALIKFNPNICKSIAIRNILNRKPWNLWRAFVKRENDKEARDKLFSALMNNSGLKLDKTIQSRYLKLWRVKADKLREKEEKETAVAKWAKSVYRNNLNLMKRNCLRLWKANLDKHLRDLANIAHGNRILNNRLKRPVLRSLLQNMDNNKVPKFLLCKKVLSNAFRKNDYNNLAFCFKLWNKKCGLQNMNELKCRLLRNIANKNDKNSAEYTSNKFKECFYRWRILSTPKPSKYLENFNNIRIGTHLLQKGCIKKYNNDFLDKLRAAGNKRKAKDALWTFLSKYDDKGKLELLRIKFRLWRIRLGDSDKMKGKLKDMVNKYIPTPMAHEKLYTKPKNDIVDAMNTWNRLKNDKAQNIQDYCKSLLLIMMKMKNIKKNALLHKKLLTLSKENLDNLKSKLRLWRSNVKKIDANENAAKIQKFCREGKQKIDEKRDVLNKFGENLTRFIKLYTFNNLLSDSKNKRLRCILIKNMKDIPEEVKKDYLKKYLLKWWRVVRDEKENDAATKINNKARALRSVKKKKLLENQKTKLDSILKSLFLKHSDKKLGALQLWRANKERLKQLEAAKKIQDFVRPKYENIKKEKAHDDLYRLIKKKYIFELKKAMKNAEKISGDRGQILCDTLNNLYQAPFDKLKLGLRWIGLIGQMRSTWPKVYQKLREHHIPPKLRLWKLNTIGNTFDKTTKIKEWKEFGKDDKPDEKFKCKNKLFEKYIHKKVKMLNLNKLLKLKLWNKKSKIIKISDKSNKIQAVWKGNKVRKLYDQELQRKKFRALFGFLQLKNQINNINKLANYMIPLKNNIKDTDRKFENRYTYNNLVNVTNNSIRNRLLSKITNKRCFNADLMSLRLWFNRWKANGEKMNNSAKKLQNGFRSKKAKEKVKTIKNVNENMKNRINKLYLCDEDKKKINLRMWNKKAKEIKVDEDGKKIRDFCRSGLNNLKLNKLKGPFVDWAKRLAKHRINNGAKTYNLLNTLRRVYFKLFLDRLKNNDKYNKLKTIFIKRIGTTDSTVRDMYLKHYLKLWRIKSKNIGENENKSAIKLQNKFRSNKAKNKLEGIKNMESRLRKTVLKLITRMVIKQQVALRLWRTTVEDEKTNENSDKIKNFCRKGQKNLRSKRKNDKKNNLDNLVNVTMKNVDRAEERPVFNKLKNEAKRKTLSKLVNNLENKKNDNLKTAVDNIKDYGDKKQEAFRKNAIKIQNAWKNLKWRRHIWYLIMKLRKLRGILRLMSDKNLRLMNKAMRLWNKNCKIPEIEDSAKKIQNFCRNKILIPRYQKKPIAQQKMQDVFRNNLLKVHLLPYLKRLTNTIKLDRMKQLLKIYMLKKFRYNLDNYEKRKLLGKLFRLPVNISNKALRSRLRLWKVNTDKLNKNEAAKKIQKNFRSANKNRKDNRKNELLDKNLKSLFLKHDNIKKYYLLLWKSQVMKINQNESATKIQKFCRKEWDRIKAAKNWWRLATGLKRREKIDNGLAILSKYKQFRKLNPLVKNWDLKLKRVGFDGLKDKGRLMKMTKLLKSIFQNFNKRGDILSLFKWWSVWRNKASKLGQRDINLDKMVKAIDTRDKINQSKTIGDACLVKRLGKLLDTVKSKLAMKKLKNKANNVKKLGELANSLVEAKKDFRDKNKENIKERLLRLYVFKVLDNMCKHINNVEEKKILPAMKKAALDKIRSKASKDSSDQYDNNKKVLRSSKPRKLNFQGETKGDDDSSYNTNNIAIPAAVKILSKLKDQKLNDALNNIKKDARDKNMAKKLKSLVKKLVPSKEDFDKLKDGLDFKGSKPDNKDKLRKMFRMHYIRKLKEDLSGPAKLYRQRRFMRLALSYKKHNNSKITLSLIRKWRYHVTAMKVFKKKLEGMYKQMHIGYLGMVNSFIGNGKCDGEGNGSIYGEFDLLNQKMGVYKPQLSNIEFSESFKTEEYPHEYIEDNDDINYNDSFNNNLNMNRYGQRYIEKSTKQIC
jgi:hypothetical protein